MEIKHINEEEFEKVIKNKTVLIDFYATWCGPCKMLAPVLEKVKDEIEIIKVDVDVCENLGIKYGIMTVPTLMIMKDSEIVATSSGFMPEGELKEWIASNK